MAFQQPTRQAMQRAARPVVEDREPSGAQNQANLQDQRLDQSQTWVLFSPAAENTITASDFSETVASAQIPDPLQASNAGNNGVESVEELVHHAADFLSSTTASFIGDGEDDGELDSLDSHLPSFRSLPRQDRHEAFGNHANHHSSSVLPAHDGLGSFHLDHPTSGIEAQNQIYRFEELNPRRARWRHDSTGLGVVQFELDQEHLGEIEKRKRIEAWRLESSRILLGEIERETQRRRHHSQTASSRPVQLDVETAKDSKVAADALSDNLSWHDEESTLPTTAPSGFLTRITTKVIKDLLGIDDRLLSILLGETIPEDDELSTTPKPLRPIEQVLPTTNGAAPWQDQVFERVSKELGMLINHISHHPGAFSTYSTIKQTPLPYAGLPVIPESTTAPTPAEEEKTSSDRQTVPSFKPTINTPTKPMDIPSRHTEDKDVNMSDTFTKQEWEKELDVKLVFKYIRSRFSVRGGGGGLSPQTNNAYLATSSTQDIAAKAARVRQNHPLISRTRPPIERRSFKATTPNSPTAAAAAALRHHQGSCASQSTWRSARRSSCSSNHYWDIGGSLATGSMIASNGPMGSWGEV